MSDDNGVIIGGRLAMEPELKTVGATQVCTLLIASEYRYRSDGEWKSKTTFVEVKAWGNEAEFAAALHKGEPLTVTGRVARDEWETESGQKRSKTYVTANTQGIHAERRRKDVIGGQEQLTSAEEDFTSDSGDEPPF